MFEDSIDCGSFAAPVNSDRTRLGCPEPGDDPSRRGAEHNAGHRELVRGLW